MPGARMTPPLTPRSKAALCGALLTLAAAAPPSSFAFVAVAPGRASSSVPGAASVPRSPRRPALASWEARMVRTTLSPLGRLRSSASDVSGDLSALNNLEPASAPTSSAEAVPKSAAALEAERLRARARALLAEAAAEEAALRASVLERKSSVDSDLDLVITRLGQIREAVPAVSAEDTLVVQKFESTMKEELPQWVKDREAQRQGRIRRVDAIREWMRGERVTTEKLIKVVERIYEREKIARNGRTAVEAAMAKAKETAPPIDVTAEGGGQAAAANGKEMGTAATPPPALDVAPASVEMPPPGAGLTFQIGAASNVAEKNEMELTSLNGLIDEIVDACDLLDEERRAKKGGERKEGANGAAVDDSTDGDGSVEGSVEVADDEERHYGLSSNSANVLRARIKDLRRADDESFKRRLASEIHAADRKFKGTGPRKVLRGELKDGETIEDFVRRTMAQSGGKNGTSVEVELTGGLDADGFNVTRFVMDVMKVPMWVPSSLLPYIITCPDELDADDAKRIKSEVLRGSTFSCSGWDSFERAAIYRGSFVGRRMARTVAAMEGKSAAEKEGTKTAEKGSEDGGDSSNAKPLSGEVFAEVRSRLDESGLSDRIQLFLMDDPEWRPGDAAETGGEYAGPPPVILAVPKSVMPEQGGERGRGAKFLAGLSVLSTLVTTFAYGVSAYALNPDFFNAVVKDNDASVLSSTVPVFVGVLAVQAVHELGHYLAAKSRDVKLGLPVPLPSLQIGTFGSITPIRSFPEMRADLMDVALAGPGLTMALSLGLMIAGIGATVGASEEVLSSLPVVPAALMKSSFLVGSLASFLAPKVMALQLSQPIPIHPLFMVGLTGLISSALNLLPIGRLDGGRAYTAAFGRRPAILVSFLFLLIMAIAALTQTSQVSIFWGLLVTVFQRNGDVPTRDEVTGVDSFRRGVYGALTAVALLVLLPFPGGPGAL